MNDVVDLAELGRTQVAEVGGKGAGLAELTRIDGVRVPPGFCVTAGAYRRIVTGTPELDSLLDRLAALGPDQREAIGAVSAQIRQVIEQIPVPEDLATAVRDALARIRARDGYAVRSSATAEDLPTASFAGQHDSFPGIDGEPAVLEHIRRCWASLFTERAVLYRRRNGFDHRRVQMAVVVQAMMHPTASGVLFTADPVTAHRRTAVVEAVRGLGDALVSGQVNPDSFTVRDGEVTARTVVAEPPALSDPQVLALTALGRRIEAHLGRPQDIEWCLVGEDLHVVQSRPITTLFPVPETDDEDFHLYLSVGHQQMMTDAMTPLGLSVWQLTTARPMAEAGGRLFVDVAPALAAPGSRASMLDALAESDPLIGDALRTVLDRGDLDRVAPVERLPAAFGSTEQDPVETDPALVEEFIARSRASLDTLRREIGTRSGPALFDLVRDDIAELRRTLFDPRSLQVIMAGMDAARWLNSHLQEWLGERNAADTLTRSVPHNVTSEMGLALLEVADVMRPHPAVVELLRRVELTGTDDGFLDELATVAGGPAARDALRGFLDEYGMRCPGEIDITRPRWSERPAALVPPLLGHIDNQAPGAGARRVELGRRQATAKENEVLQRLRELPDGTVRAERTKRMIDRLRAFAGYREYPKFGMICRYFVYKQALLREAERLVEAGVVHEVDDVFQLRFDEFQEAVRTHRADEHLIAARRSEFRSFQSLTPPRVSTSDGEVITGSYRRTGLPPGALPGLAVSAGTVQGRARVVTDMARADLGAGNILVTAYTDPSWTPLFLGIAGLVTEVGGLMTHGAVIAREYGLPAVVGVPGATRLIRDGQQVRVHGTEGYVELLPDPGG